MFGKFGSLLSFREHTLGPNRASLKRRPRDAAKEIGLSSEQLECRALLTFVPGTDVNVSQLFGDQVEVSIAVNPTNPQNLIMVSSGGDTFGDEQFIARSVDGGLNWTRTPLDFFDDNQFNGVIDRSEASVAFDAFGNVHIAYKVHRNLTAVDTYAIIHARSSDGGANYTTQIIRNYNSVNDRPRITTGPDASNPDEQVILVAYRSNAGLVVSAATSTGLGSVNSFAPPVTFGSTGNFAVPAIGPDGQIAITWMESAFGQGPGNIQYTRDINGLVGGLAFSTEDTITASNVGGSDTIPATPTTPAYASPFFAYDNSNGLHRGRLYMAYAEEPTNENSDHDIMIRYSDDNGTNWSLPIQINDDLGTASQFFHSISVDPVTGFVVAGWYDTRNDLGDGNGSDSDNVARTDAQYFGSVSYDGGNTWQPNVQISDGASNESAVTPNSPRDYGRYTGIAAYRGVAYAAWADNSDSTGDNPNGTRGMDLYFDTISFNVGPTINFVPDITITGTSFDEDTTSSPLPFTIGDDATLPDNLILTAVSSDTTLIPNTGFVFSGAGANRTLSLTPAANRSGKAVITVTVSDGVLTASRSFTVTVLPTPDSLPVPSNSNPVVSTFSDATATPIADNDVTLSSSITVSGLPTFLFDANVQINVSHTRNSDLTVVLISPSGTRVTLTSGNGGSFDNVFAGSTFDDQATTTPVSDFAFANNSTAVYLVPEGAMGQLVGEDPNGDWSLEISDGAGGETGTLNSWSLELTSLSSPPQLQSNVGSQVIPVSIPDDQTVLESTINLNGLDFFTWSVVLTANIAHSNSSDLEVFLVSPSGTEVAITTRNGANFDNVYNNATFSDQSTTPVTDHVFANNASVGSVIPEGALSAFFGENPNGIWKLRVIDKSATGTGTLSGWGLDITTIFFNDSPTIGIITNPGAIVEDSAEQTVTMNSISAGGGESQPIRIVTSSNNPGLIPNPTVQYLSPQSNGTLKYTPVANQSGFAVVTVYVEDGGFDQDLTTSSDNKVTTTQFTVVVNPVNDLPTFTIGATGSPVQEDAAQVSVALTGVSPGPGETQPLQFTATSNNPLIIPNPTIQYQAGANSAVLHYQPAANANGTVELTITATDGGLDGNLATTDDNLTVTKTFTIQVTAVNDMPTLAPISDPAPLSEDSPQQIIGLTGISTGGNEVQPLRVSATSSNPNVISDVSVQYDSPNSVGFVRFRPVQNAFGTATITVTVEDGGIDGNINTSNDNATFSQSFLVTIIEVNDPPVFNPLGTPPVILEDALPQTLNISGISAGQFETQNLSLSVTSSNTDLIPTPSISFTSPNSTGSIGYIVNPDRSGTSTLTITLTDGGQDNDLATTSDNQSFSRTVLVTVEAVNDSPTLNDIANPPAISEDSSPLVIPFTGVTAGGGESQAIRVTATSSFPSILPHPVVNYTSGATGGTITLQPAPNQHGTVVITVTVTDAGLDGDLETSTGNGQATKSFQITINPVNDAPSFDPIPTPNPVSQDSGLQTISITGITPGPNESSQLQFTAVSSDLTLMQNPTVGYLQGNTSAILNLQPEPGRSGTVNITVTVTDPGLDGNFATANDNLSFSQTITQVINPINLSPTIGPVVAPPEIPEDSGVQVVPLTGISAGEAGQVFSVTAASDNTALIPTVNVQHTPGASTASLSFTTAQNAVGTATVTISVMDGGFDNNLATLEDNLTTTASFQITVLPGNDAPTINTLGGTLTVPEDAVQQTISLTGITAGGGETQPLAVTVMSLNPALIANPTLEYSFPNTTGTLRFIPASNLSGSAVIRIRLEDGGFDGDLTTAEDNAVTFEDLTVVVEDTNDLPTLNSFVPRTILLAEDATAVVVNLSGISGGLSEVETVQITAISSNPAVVPNPTVTYVTGSATGSISIQPAANQSGTATITVTVTDERGGQISRTLEVTVTPVNDSPTINAIAGPVVIDEDSGEQTVNLTGITAGSLELDQVFQVTTFSSDTSILPDPTLVYTPGNTTGSLKFQPLANQDGTVTVTVRVVDGGADNNLNTTTDNLTTDMTFTVQVTPQPEVPSLEVDEGTLSVNRGRPTAVVPGAVLTDPDSPNYRNGSLTFALIEGSRPGDRLELSRITRGSKGLKVTKSGELKRGKQVIGQVTGGEGEVPLVVKFTSDIGLNDVQSVIRGVRFRGSAKQTGLRTVSVFATDETGSSTNSAIRLVSVR